ncbi:AraC family transcriptional regulator [Zavarzinia compransoris]|uniref:AraC family transcriptional regulator n=1 Tax=Zavarzinia marina TaxID=2911065 RepID=UPI001F3395DC|nr:AraC family transcriptional regulator [Zavarzinia marina]MCF4167348.1 AraC family transcriptional regulator [Zavarzinia marina]
MTRPRTRESYETRLERVTDYLYRHLDEDIRPEHLAEIACLSPYHWHRIYSAMRGETLGITIRRLRLQRAADRLANTGATVDVVADRAGYSSADSFARAFKDAYGQTPAAYRTTGSHARFKSAAETRDVTGFPVTIETLPCVRCASIPHSGPYMEIDRAMARLFGALAARDLVAADQKMIAVFYDDPDLVRVGDLRSRACSPVTDDVAFGPPLEVAELRGGLYARLRYQGPYADMKNAYRWLMGVWLPRSGYEPDDAPVFEAYLNSPRQVPATALLTDIHLPVKLP